ncbi:D-glucuronyl C5-epimerase family protein [Oribacterium sp. HCP3S3_B9]|uniref:D-glucuronyl C5-epimerase family protein n=1 Tax=Oribacterium sp. HCP3S3_B9 TaxID=3438946 RepID=UPI003F8AA7CA
MAITFYNLQKWCRMLTGKSIQHVNQGLGKAFSISELKGYYNDLTEKVSESQELDSEGIPLLTVDSGEKIYFPIMIFQYGLGAYDLYLLSDDKSMFEKAKKCADWAMEFQNKNGSWDNFAYEFPDHPFSSMAQGEATSLLLRLYETSKDERYLSAARKAIDFMLLDINNGGTTEYLGEDIFFHEFTHKPVVLNGWIFSIWGLYDYNLVCGTSETKKIFEKTVQSLVNHLDAFDNGYWSMYDCAGMITSPFYHNLHIAQMKAMYAITHNAKFQEMAEKWSEYQQSIINRSRSFIKKAYQKILE